LNVMYDDQRSDCIDCKKCIQVCPTRIDIRKGLQMECIACTACIDACNTIMDKVKQPRNLISYSTLDRQKFKIFKGRSIVYLALIFLCAGALAYNVAYRSPLQVFILRGRDAPFQISTLNGSSERTITNHLKLDIHNQTFDEQHIKISLDPTFVNSKLITAQPVTKLSPGESKIIHIFVQFPESASKGSGQIKTNLNFVSEHLNLQKELSLVGPY